MVLKFHHVAKGQMAAWEEVRKLAADFQRLQASSTAHRLSERNCVEVVGRLLDMGLLEVVHTLDGKEYVTPHHLEKEVRDELTAHRGRRWGRAGFRGQEFVSV